MTQALAASLIVPLLLPAGAFLNQDRPSKPIRVHEVHLDGGPGVPATLEQLWKQADAVVEGSIVSQRPADKVITVPNEQPATLVRTAIRMRVDQTYKAPARPDIASDYVEVILPVGDRDRGDHIASYVDPSFPVPKIGDRYILFLRLHDNDGVAEYSPATAGADSAFLVQSDRILSVGRSALSRTLSGTSPAAFTALLKSHKAKE